MTIFTDFPAASMAEGPNFSFAIDIWHPNERPVGVSALNSILFLNDNFKMHSAFHAMFLHLPWTTIFCRNYPLNHHSSKDRKRRTNRCKRKAKGYQKDKTCDLLSLCHPFAFRLLSFCDPFVILSGFPRSIGQCSIRKISISLSLCRPADWPAWVLELGGA